MALLIETFVVWLVLPGIMLSLFGFAHLIASRAGTPELKVSAWAGVAAGLVTFVIYAVSQLGQVREPDFRFARVPGLLVRPLAGGAAAGFLFVGLVRVVLPTRLVGVLTSMPSAAVNVAPFTYVFLPVVRLPVLYGSLGAALGILLHVVLFPRSLRHLFREPSGLLGESSGAVLGRDGEPSWLEAGAPDAGPGVELVAGHTGAAGPSRGSPRPGRRP